MFVLLVLFGSRLDVHYSRFEGKNNNQRNAIWFNFYSLSNTENMGKEGTYLLILMKSRNFSFKFPLNPLRFTSHQRNWDKLLFFNFSKLQFVGDKIDQSTSDKCFFCIIVNFIVQILKCTVYKRYMLGVTIQIHMVVDNRTVLYKIKMLSSS